MSKVVVLGGAGDMGGRTVRELCREEGAGSDAGLIGEVVVADYRLDKAEKLAAEIGGKARAAFVDARVKDSVVGVVKGATVAVNAIGPFYRYAEGILAAVMEAGVDYVDICDDDDATMKLLAFDSMARRRGVTAVIGNGWTPGISNLLARMGADQMDRVRDIDLVWVGSTADSEGEAVIKHVIHAITRDVPMYLDGRWTSVPALSGVKTFPFPDPIGPVSAYFCGHPEALTIPRFIDGLRNVTVRGYLLPDEIQKVACGLIDLDLVNTEKKVDAIAGLLQPMLPLLSSIGEKTPPPLSAIRVDVWGVRDGKEAHAGYCSVDSMDRLTGIPPAVVAKMLLRGEIPRPGGVFAPEGIVPPKPFFAALAERDIEVEEVEAP